MQDNLSMFLQKGLTDKSYNYKNKFLLHKQKMKRTVLLAAFFLYYLSGFATTHYVDENGSTGNFEIQHAIDKAADGDRIVVVPKASGTKYRGFDLNKNNIEIISANENTRFKIEYFYLSGNNNSLINAEIIYASGGQTLCLNTGVNNLVAYCYFQDMQLSNYSSGLKFDQNTCRNGLFEFHSGRISGCNFEYSQSSYNYFIALYLSDNDSLSFVGNKFKIVNPYSAYYAPIYFGLYGASFIEISNNIFSQLNSMYQPLIEFVTSISTHYKLKGIKIENNNFRDSINYSGYPLIVFYTNYKQDMIIKNNAFDTHSYIGAPAFATIKYNYFRYQNTVYTADSTNVYDANLRLNPDGSFVNNCNAINGGDPSPMYLDLDLTRNDAGCYGGSYSISNFTTPETGARVLFMKAPRVVYSSSPIEISADGIDK
jgi:hypothetical protein